MFISDFCTSGDVTGYLYATLSAASNSFECEWSRDSWAAKSIYNKMTLMTVGLFISVITQQCLHTVGQSLHFNNIRATITMVSCLSSINMYIKHHLSHNHSVLTDSVFPWSCFGVCRLVFSRCCWHRLGLLEGIVGKSLPQRTWRDISGKKSAWNHSLNAFFKNIYIKQSWL